jgi:hypothetical protein
VTDQSRTPGDSTTTPAKLVLEAVTDLPLAKRPRAARLIEQLLGTGAISSSELADAIVCDGATLEAYRLGRRKMPLERQLCLALVAIERVPAARRAGFALRSQVEAELAVAATLTETHDQPPVTHRWP